MRSHLPDNCTCRALIWSHPAKLPAAFGCQGWPSRERSVLLIGAGSCRTRSQSRVCGCGTTTEQPGATDAEAAGQSALECDLCAAREWPTSSRICTSTWTRASRPRLATPLSRRLPTGCGKAETAGRRAQVLPETLRRSHLPPDPEPRLTERHQRLSLSSAGRVFAAAPALCRLRHEQEAHQPLAARSAPLRAAST